jgi:hypothetical protein
MLCSTVAYSSGTHAPPPSTNAESIYVTNGANANKGLYLSNHLFIGINFPCFRLLDIINNI